MSSVSLSLGSGMGTYSNTSSLDERRLEAENKKLAREIRRIQLKQENMRLRETLAFLQSQMTAAPASATPMAMLAPLRRTSTTSLDLRRTSITSLDRQSPPPALQIHAATGKPYGASATPPPGVFIQEDEEADLDSSATAPPALCDWKEFGDLVRFPSSHSLGSNLGIVASLANNPALALTEEGPTLQPHLQQHLQPQLQQQLHAQQLQLHLQLQQQMQHQQHLQSQNLQQTAVTPPAASPSPIPVPASAPVPTSAPILTHTPTPVHGHGDERLWEDWEQNDEFDDYGRRLDTAGIIVYSEEPNGEWSILLSRQRKEILPGGEKEKEKDKDRREYYTHMRGYYSVRQDLSIQDTAVRILAEFTRNVPLTLVGEDEAENGQSAGGQPTKAVYVDHPFIVRRKDGPHVEVLRLFFAKVPTQHMAGLVELFNSRTQIQTRKHNRDYTTSAAPVYHMEGGESAASGEGIPIPTHYRGLPAQAFDERTGALRYEWADSVELRWFSQKELIGCLVSEGMIGYTRKGILHFAFRRALVRLLFPAEQSPSPSPAPRLVSGLMEEQRTEWEQIRSNWGSFFTDLNPTADTLAACNSFFQNSKWSHLLKSLAKSEGVEGSRTRNMTAPVDSTMPVTPIAPAAPAVPTTFSAPAPMGVPPKTVTVSAAQTGSRRSTGSGSPKAAGRGNAMDALSWRQ